METIRTGNGTLMGTLTMSDIIKKRKKEANFAQILMLNHAKNEINILSDHKLLELIWIATKMTIFRNFIAETNPINREEIIANNPAKTQTVTVY